MKRLHMLLLTLLLAACENEDDTLAKQPVWQLSSDYVANTMLKSDAAVAEALGDDEIERLNAADLTGGVYARYRRMAANMKLHPVPALYVDSHDMRVTPQAMARFTQQGRAMVIVNPAALGSWSPRELVAVLGHELVHLKEGHVTAASLAEAYNHQELSVEHELLADRIGSGPLGSCDPQALASALKVVFAMNASVSAPEGSLDSLTGADHPDPGQRLAQLDAMATDPPPGCR